MPIILLKFAYASCYYYKYTWTVGKMFGQVISLDKRGLEEYGGAVELVLGGISKNWKKKG